MSAPQRIGRGKAALASVAYVVVSTCLLTLGTWAIVKLDPDIVGLLLAMLGTSGSQSQVGLWLLVWPTWLIPMLVAAQLTCMTWVMQTARGATPTRRSEWFALASCRFVAVLIGLAFGGAVFELLLELNSTSDLAGIASLTAGASLTVVGVARWARRRAERTSCSTRHCLIAEHFRVLSRFGSATLMIAACLYFADQILGPFHLGVVGLCTLLFGMQPSFSRRVCNSWRRQELLSKVTSRLGNEASPCCVDRPGALNVDGKQATP